MFRMRKAKSAACARVIGWITGRDEARDLSAVQMAQMTSAIHLRAVRGETTTLRQLHKISDLGQPQALTVIAELERAGVVLIDRNLSDAFESVVSLSDEACDRLDRAFDTEKTLRRA